MALPPSVPTSFVPRPQASSVRRRSNFTGAFAFAGYGLLTVAIALSIGAFIYVQILVTEQANRDKQLEQEISTIDPHTVTKFIRLRDRLSYGLTLLDKHVALSGFWSTLTGISPANVRFASMHISQDGSGLIRIQATGVAKSFNALAATSDVFAKDGRIKDAIFSSIRVEGSAVSFSLAATIDSSLVTFSPESSQAAASSTPRARTTASTTLP